MPRVKVNVPPPMSGNPAHHARVLRAVAGQHPGMMFSAYFLQSAEIIERLIGVRASEESAPYADATQQNVIQGCLAAVEEERTPRKRTPVKTHLSGFFAPSSGA